MNVEHVTGRNIKVLFSEQCLAARINELAEQIHDAKLNKLLVIPITSGNSGTPVSVTLPANDGYTVGFRQAVDVTVG